jgi:activator of 2-hydroxyglutaryl-CoA dehydratase
MINRVSSQGAIVFTGGVAKNPCMAALLAQKLGREILVPDDPQLVGALGAALLAGENPPLAQGHPTKNAARCQGNQ